MFKIIDKRELATDTSEMTVEAPLIARKAKAGQFVVVVIDEKGERIPLTLADWNTDKGTVTLIFQKVGFTTKKLGSLDVGDSLQHLLGPLGHPAEIKPLVVNGGGNQRSQSVKTTGTVYCIGGGVGIAEVYPVARGFKKAGYRLIGIIGARTKDLLILEKKMQDVCDELFVATDDGSYGRKGLVTDILKGLLDVIEKSTHTQYPDLIYCVGPVAMMKAISELTKDYKIKTIASLSPIMVDATGMCGSCRLTVAGKTVFGCVDGPDFDGHKVDFDELQKRLKLFEGQERQMQ